MWPWGGYFSSLALIFSLVKWDPCISWTLRPIPAATSYISMIQTLIRTHQHPEIMCRYLNTIYVPLCAHEWLYDKFTIQENGLHAISNHGSLFTQALLQGKTDFSGKVNTVKTQGITQAATDGSFSALFSKLIYLLIGLLIYLLQWKRH